MRLTFTQIASCIVVAGAFALLPGGAAAQPAVEISTIDATRLRFGRDPRVPCFFPGNIGQLVFRQKRPDLIGNAVRPDELKCDGQVVLAMEQGYDFSPFDRAQDAEAGYWARLQALFGSATMTGAMVDYRFDEEFAAHYMKLSPEAKTDVFAGIEKVCRRTIVPMFTVNVQDDQLAEELGAGVREELPNALVGRVIFRAEQIRTSGTWDFLVLRENAAPPEYAGQAAASYFRGVAGGRPVLLVVKEPSFYRELFGMVAGIAGFYHELPAPGEPHYDQLWRDLRSFAAFRGGLPHQLDLVQLPGATNIDAAFGAGGRVLVVLPKTGAVATVHLTPPADRPEMVGFWYNPQTDQRIVGPRASFDGNLHLEPPSSDAWMYCHVPLGRSGAGDTTTPAVQIPPPEDLI